MNHSTPSCFSRYLQTWLIEYEDQAVQLNAYTKEEAIEKVGDSMKGKRIVKIINRGAVG